MLAIQPLSLDGADEELQVTDEHAQSDNSSTTKKIASRLFETSFRVWTVLTDDDYVDNK